MSHRGKRAAQAIVVAVLVGTALVGTPARAESAPQALTIPGGPTSATDAAPVQLDADLWLPATTPAPAVVLAHGFGGSKSSVASDAAYLAERGFVVLAYSARGFGASTGLISMNAPQFEVADAQAVIDELATRPEVRQEGPDDPVVGVAGGSYGGALALLLAGYDERVDAVAADITWNDLQRSLFAQSADAPQPGVYKQLWTAAFFSAGLNQPGAEVTTCGRFTQAWCDAYNAAATTGTVTRDAAALMRASSPASVTDRIAVPTLLGGGQSDSLFPLAEVNANAEQIAAAHPDVPLKVVWHAGGHDGGVSETDRLRALTADWMAAHLADGPAVDTAAEFSLVEASALSDREQGTVEILTAAQYPGLFGDTTVDVPVGGERQSMLAPAGGLPAAISSLPGLGRLTALAGGLALPGTENQTATFLSAPLESPLRVIGSSRVALQVSSAVPARDVTLFASLRIVGAAGRPSLPAGLVAPIRLAAIGPSPTTVEVDLPAVVTQVAAGDRLAVVVSTTDQAYRSGAGPLVVDVALASSAVAIPQVDAVSTSTSWPAWLWPLVAVAVIVLLALLVRLVRPRPGSHPHREDLAQTPVHAVGLAKQFRHGVRAVDGVDFTVPTGVVLGLLGPNGAGKTTTMRMVMGLIAPSDGEAYVFGERVTPGAAVLARIGSFVEGPGFLPHLSGRQNLALYWRASGRSGDARLDQVLEIAGLGTAIDRRVRTYSQGMRQRLGIAQAMLGMPDLLLLDEPTNGLDPPQIREMRRVVQDYAATGRTVIISSHLLAEVEQTCSEVIVMHRGRVIAAGAVSELLAGRTGQRLEDVFMEMVGNGHEVVSS